MSTITDYFKFQNMYQEKYGDRTVVLMQIGSFYEIYEYDPSRDQDGVLYYDHKLGWSRELGLLLNMVLTSKSKNKPHNLTNPYMIGFPCLAYERHRDVILANNYTIIRFDQSPDDPKNRVIGEIASAATEIDMIYSTYSTNQVASIYIECQGVNRSNPRGHDDYIIISGMSCIDVTTGVNVISEVYSQENNNIYALQEIYRFLSSHQPREVIVHIKTPSKMEQSQLDIYVSNIYDTLELNRYTVIGPKINQIESEYLSVNYQEQFMERLFPSPSEDAIVSSSKRSAISVIERLDLERMSYGMISYIVLLQYCHEHNDTLIQRIHKPTTTWTDQSKHLILAHNAIHQLDIIPSSEHGGNMSNRGHKKIDSLLSVLNNTSTAGGKRLLRKMLLAPITDSIRLNQLYGATEELMSSQPLIKSMTTSLKNIPDLERLHRKLLVQKITPKELSMLGRAYLRVITLYQDIFDFVHSDQDKDQGVNMATMLLSNEISSSFNQCLGYLMMVLNFDKLDHCKFLMGKKESRIDADESFFNVGIDSTLDLLDTNIKHCKRHLELICDHLNGFLSSTGAKYIVPESGRKTKSTPTVEKYDDISVSMTTTLTRANNLKKKLGSVDVELCGNLEFTKVTKGMSISSDKIRECVTCLERSQSQLEIRLYQMYTMIIAKLANEFTFYSSLDEFVSYIDYIKTNACNASNYKYHRPTINMEATSSYLKIEKARHPIIERILPSEYIPNDVSLGSKTDTSIGMLLYGVNSAGKSSLTKSIGLIIVMAQAGMFVPGILTYKPYTRINTRLSGNDDIFKGQSSFVVEMTELRNILKNASDATLVLGDELCRGTESISGTSLTVATIETLVEAKSSFIFSTHMHHLPTYPSIETMGSDQLRICHLSTYYDEELRDLVYDRKLNDGPGSSVYGLEVCRSLSMDSKFIDKANEIRKNIAETPSLLDVKKSRYNASVYVDKCSMCGKPSGDSNNKSHHTHHIKEQQTADTNGFIDTFHKNTSFNLIALCSNCHENLHKSNLELVPKQTLAGLCFDVVGEDEN